MDDFGILLQDVPGFPRELVDRLAGLWLTTAEEFVAATTSLDGITTMAGYLETTPDQVGQLVQLAQRQLPTLAAFSDEEDFNSRGLGALDEYTPEDNDLSPPSLAPSNLPSSVNLADRLGPARDQGERGTCVAFALVALREIIAGNTSDLSEQFLYWACKQNDGAPQTRGTWLQVGVDVLQDYGVCPQEIWPYSPEQRTGNEAHDPLPSGADQQALSWRIVEQNQLSGRLVQPLKSALAGGQPVATAVTVFSFWKKRPVTRTGKIRLPLPDELSEESHAICLLGYNNDDDVPGGGYFIARNSWGTNWAVNSPVQRGCALLPYAYLMHHGVVAYTALASTGTVTTQIPHDYAHGIDMGVRTYIEAGPYNVINVSHPVPVPSTYAKAPPRAQAQLFLEGDFAKFDQKTLVAALSGILNIPQGEINVLYVTQGSIRVMIELPSEAAERLYHLAVERKPYSTTRTETDAPTRVAVNSEVTQESQLLQVLEATCSRTDIRWLAFALGYSMDNLRGHTLIDQMISLIEEARRDRKMKELTQRLCERKPHVADEFGINCDP